MNFGKEDFTKDGKKKSLGRWGFASANTS